MFFFTAHQKQRRDDTPDVGKGDLVLPTGTFLVTDTGVLCQFKTPLSRMSGHYTWERIPFGIAVLKLLIVGAETDAFTKVVQMLRFTDDELDMIEHGLGRISSFEEGDSSVYEVDESAHLAHDIQEVLSWAENLAIHCPMLWVSHDLKRLPRMPSQDLGNYVGGYIGLG